MAIKHLVKLSVEHDFFSPFFPKRKTCHGQINGTRKKKNVSYIFLCEIHIHVRNFKTLACKVLEEQMRCTTNMACQLLCSWGIKYSCFSYIFLQLNICCGTH